MRIYLATVARIMVPIERQPPLGPVWVTTCPHCAEPVSSKLGEAVCPECQRPFSIPGTEVAECVAAAEAEARVQQVNQARQRAARNERKAQDELQQRRARTVQQSLAEEQRVRREQRTLLRWRRLSQIALIGGTGGFIYYYYFAPLTVGDPPLLHAGLLHQRLVGSVLWGILAAAGFLGQCVCTVGLLRRIP